MDNSSSPIILKIITVEDSPIVAERIQTMLAEVTYAEFMGNAENVSSALNLITQHQPDVVILDISLVKEKGNIGGINLLIILRQKYRDLIIIMLTNLVEPQYRNTCMMLGANYFFDKSNDFEKIPEALKEAIQLKINNPFKKNQRAIIGVSKIAQEIIHWKQLDEAKHDLDIANEELQFQKHEKKDRADELIIANKEKQERADELLIANEELQFQKHEKKDRADELIIANKELQFQTSEKKDRADELVIANKEKKDRAKELAVANKELQFQKKEKKDRADELIIANKELQFQTSEKKDRADELVIANKEKKERADELLIANIELEFQSVEKKERADELIVANKELQFQGEEKQHRADELVLANNELEFQAKEKKDRANESIAVQNKLELEERRTEELTKAYKEISDYKSAIDASAIVAITDQKGIIQHVNDNFCTISKYSRKELIGQDHRIINSGHHSKEFIRDMWKTITNGKIWKGELKNKAKDGSIYWVDTAIVPFLNDKGKPYQYVAIRSDITESKKLAEQQAMFALIINSSDDAIISKNLEGIITSWNHGAEKQYGYSLKEIVGKHISILIPTHLCNEEKEIVEKVSSGNSLEYYETERLRKDGNIIQVSLTLSPIRDLMGNIIGVSKISRDITKKNKLEALLDKANRLAKIGNWEADLIKGTVYWSAVTAEIHETETGYVPDLSKGLRFYKEGENRDRITQCVQTCIEQGTAWEEELQIVTAKGNLKWIKTIGSAEFMEGKCIRFYGSFQDIDERKKAEEEIHRVSAQQVATLNALPANIALLDLEGTIISVNEAWKTFARANGVTHANYNLGDNYITISENATGADEQAGKAMAHSIREILKGNENEFLLEYPCHSPTEERWFQVKIAPSQNGKLNGAVVMHINITERKKAENILKASEEKFHSLFENMSEGFAHCQMLYENEEGVDFIYLDVNKKFGELTGLKGVVGRKRSDVIWEVKNKDSSIFKIYNSVLKTGISAKGEYFNDALAMWFYITVYKTSAHHFVEVFEEITERKTVRDKMFALSERLQIATKAAKLGIWDYNPLNNSLTWDDRMYQLYGITTDKFSGAFEAWEARLHPDDLKRAAEELQTAVNGGKDFDTEFRVVWPDQSIHHIKADALMYRNVEGVPIRMIGTNRDITERKEAEEKLTHERALLRTLIDNLPDYIYVKDTRSRHLLNNKANVELLGASTEKETLGKSLSDFMGSENARTYLENDQEVFLIGKPIINQEEIIQSATGELKYLLTTKVPLRDEKNIVVGLVGISRDITRQKRAEEKIKQSEKIYKTIAANIPGSAVFLVDQDYRYLLIEGSLIDQLGYPARQLIGNKADEVLAPERFAEMLPSFKRVFNGETFHVEFDRGDFQIITKFVPLKDEDEKVYAGMAVVLDVTEQKKSERLIAELNVGLEQKIAERTTQLKAANSEMEAFSYSISHDLRAPLRAINGYASMLTEDYNSVLDDNGKRLLKIVQQNATQMGQLIEDLLAFARMGRKEILRATIDMTALVKNVVQELMITNPDVEIHINSLHAISGDRTLLKQVLINYLSNAVKYSAKADKPYIEIKSALSGNEVIYSVSDNGSGFDMAYVDKLFKVFQRLHTHEEYEGTGVGLAIVGRIIAKHGGKVWAEGEIGKGATFHFSLPAIIT